MGLAFRVGISCQINLPKDFQDVLSLSSKRENNQQTNVDKMTLSRTFTLTAAWALRQGLTTVYPEVHLTLFNKSDELERLKTICLGLHF